ncbi:methyltransferase domain-containing protein [Diaporthe helianthi]|uniref:Methyltransferase domain-containing protein n=1 Tax=Diaporthe helianthi TaxID=158607 RepID=A0A2P5HR65_DIAHE|nr:methyltransferase domain-containing protein [Diaporthe helianthi]
MAELVILPQNADHEPIPQGRRRPRGLNTIIEEENEDHVSSARSRSPFLRRNIARDKAADQERLQAWLVPLDAISSEDLPTPRAFPTPRGFHFMTAPTLPSSPSSASASGEEGSSHGSSSSRTNSWTRHSAMTDVTEFDDLYGVSDESEPEIQPMRAPRNRKSKGPSAPSRTSSNDPRKALPQLVIPVGHQLNSAKWSPKHQDLKQTLVSPMPPTPPSAVAMSPAMLSYMQAKHAQPIPTISAPPSLDGSLDGSLTSEQLAAMSAPPTPVMGNENPEDSGDWAGIQLQPGALATLQALSGPEADEHGQPHHEQAIGLSREPMAESRQAPPRLMTRNLPRATIMLSPAQQRSMTGLTKLDIPSPGGFFSGLSPRTRTTWHLETPPADEVAPPTSTTAEQFYRLPWNMAAAPPSMPNPPRPEQIVEQVVEMPEVTEEEIQTAKRVEEPVTARRIPTSHLESFPEVDEDVQSPTSPKEEDHVKEIVVDYDPEYARKQQEISGSHLDRTEVWLRAQFAYLRGVGFESTEADAETEPGRAAVTTEESQEASDELEKLMTTPPKGSVLKTAISVTSPAAAKKSVRFSNRLTFAPAEGDIPKNLPSKLLRQESAFYRAFQSMTVSSTRADVFVHRLPRFEALQAARISLREQHRDRLLGKYQLSVVPQSAKKRMSANVARGDDEVFEDPEKMRLDKEAEALKQMANANWHVAATKMLNGGRLVCAPVHKRLARLSLLAPSTGGRLRILDLGGQAACDWAWHAALQYPNAKVYTVTTKAIRQLSNSNIRGPPNHRQVAVNSLGRLPFADDQFDVVSARELHNILRSSDVPEKAGGDEWDACLGEVMRVLKPSGYVDFSVMDSDLVNAGPLGLAKSVEFGFTLKTLGYDPAPTRSFLSRLSRAGFEHVRRGWAVLPLGPKPAVRPGPIRYGPNGPIGAEPSPPSGGKTLLLDAMAPGSLPGSTDAAAAVAGLAGTWSWERWILRCEMEKAAGEAHSGFSLADTVTTDGGAMKEAGKSLEGVHAVVEEGRACGAGLRLLKGHARKPERSVTQDVLDALECLDVTEY